MSDHLLHVSGLKKYFPVLSGVFKRTTGYVHAVDGVNFHIDQRETFGLVGESGCGKTTLGRTILRLIEATAGTVEFEGTDIFHLKKMDEIRRKMQIVFQDPESSLNPRFKVKTTLSEALSRVGVNRHERRRRILELLKETGLSDAHAERYPHQMSGGEKQRVGIARALAVNPTFIVADEAVSSLDVSVRAQILNLLFSLQEKLDLTYLFITHDLSVVKHISDRVAVMYVGKFMELASVQEIFKSPLHPYTKALMSAIPEPDPDMKRDRIVLKGEVPSPINPPSGCRFHPRCSDAKPHCKEVEPELKMLRKTHYVACHAIE